jgi:PII-like signaling protein
MKASSRQQNPVQGFQLTFFTRRDHRHHHKSLAHWLVEEARAMGIGGATLISATEGFGHRQHLHRVHLVDLSEQPLEVVMAVTSDEADRLFAKLASEKIKVVYSKSPVEFGTTGEEE